MQILTAIIEILVGGITKVAEGIGAGLSTLVQPDWNFLEPQSVEEESSITEQVQEQLNRPMHSQRLE